MRVKKRWYVPSTDEVAALEELDQRFRSCQADQHIRVETAADARLGGTFFDIPGRRSVNRRHWKFGFLHGPNNRREWLPNFSGEAKAWSLVSNGDDEEERRM